MRRNEMTALSLTLLVLAALGAAALYAQETVNSPNAVHEQTARHVSQVVKALSTLGTPETPFDFINAAVSGPVVVLQGFTINDVLKKNAQAQVEKLSWVVHVVNEVEYLKMGPEVRRMRRQTLAKLQRDGAAGIPGKPRQYPHQGHRQRGHHPGRRHQSDRQGAARGGGRADQAHGARRHGHESDRRDDRLTSRLWPAAFHDDPGGRGGDLDPLLPQQTSTPKQHQHLVPEHLLLLAQLLGRNWGTFELGQLESNPAQGYDGRLILGGGAAYYLIESSREMLNLDAGVVYNGEIVTGSSEKDHSAEALLGMSYKHFKRGSHSPSVQLSLLTFTTISGGSRFRAVLSSNVSWKVIGDFTFSVQLNERYDTDPPGDRLQQERPLPRDLGRIHVLAKVRSSRTRRSFE